MEEFLGTILNIIQIRNLSMHGYAVLPIHMTNIINSIGKVVSLNWIMESGVNVNPRLLNVVNAEKKALEYVKNSIQSIWRFWECLPPGRSDCDTL